MLRVLSAMLVLTVLVGCAAPTRATRELPAPMMQTRARQRRATPPPPPPVQHEVKRTPARRLLGAVTIMVDPGHGGKDPGALGVGPVPEKTVNLGIATQLARKLESYGATVLMTRRGDRFPELDERAAMAERAKVDLFVSIHADSARRASATGAAVYIARSASKRSSSAAQSVVAALRKAGIKCNGIRKAGFRVLVGHSRPSMLVECGYLTNPTEAARLATSSYQTQIADAIAAGILNEFGG